MADTRERLMTMPAQVPSRTLSVDVTLKPFLAARATLIGHSHMLEARSISMTLNRRIVRKRSMIPSQRRAKVLDKRYKSVANPDRKGRRHTRRGSRADYRQLRQKIHDCILRRCSEPRLTADDIAKSLHVSLRTLHRALSDGPEHFASQLLSARIALAQQMLESPQFDDLTTAAIGLKAGFADASHFVRAYRKQTGQTPLAVRSMRTRRLGDAD